MKGIALRASYICAALCAGLLALHFNAEWLPAWTEGLSLLGGVVALAGAALGAVALGTRGWTNLRHWSGQVALALNAFFALALLL